MFPAPWGANVPRCSTECPVTGSPKLAYQPDKTYAYQYSGKSKVQLKGVDNGDSETEWTAQVDLTWISPCDMAISFKNTKVDGTPGKRMPTVPSLHANIFTQVSIVPSNGNLF